jgi:hypothetical protein
MSSGGGSGMYVATVGDFGLSKTKESGSEEESVSEESVNEESVSEGDSVSEETDNCDYLSPDINELLKLH